MNRSMDFLLKFSRFLNKKTRDFRLIFVMIFFLYICLKIAGFGEYSILTMAFISICLIYVNAYFAETEFIELKNEVTQKDNTTHS